jgi:hypothetical protein
MGTYFLAKWLHIVAMAYWLGGEWGVFNSSRYVVDPKLSFGERMRHMETAFRIDVLARVTDRARPGCVVALSIWWKKLARDGKNANELTSGRLTDIGRAPTFYDCLVEIAPQ